MKKLCILLVLLSLLLAGCAKEQAVLPEGATPEDVTEAAEPTQSDTEEPTEDTFFPDETSEEQDLLVGTWRNDGQYAEGQDFVETMTLSEEGLCIIDLQYEGEHYDTLIGAYAVVNGTLYTRTEKDGERTDRVFQYRLDGRELYLENENKTVRYIKVG